MRPAVLLVLAAAGASGCGLLPDPPVAADARAARVAPVPVHPDSLLARLTRTALDDAYDGAALTVAFAEGDARPQPLADTARSPLPLVLPDLPAFADPRARDQYARRRVPTAWPRAAAAEAVYRPEGREAQPVRRVVVVVDTATGRVLAAEVWRRSRSLLYDEAIHVQAWRHPATGRLARARIETSTDTPGNPPRRYVQTATAR